MNKNTFLSELSRKLRGLPRQECDEALNYYNEYFLDAGIGDMDDVTPLVGTVDEVADRIREECTDKQIDKVNEEGGIKNSTTAIWLIIIGIFAAPIAFPVALTIAILAFTLVIVAGSIILALLISAFAIFIVGLVLIPSVFWCSTFAQGLVLLGIAFVLIGLGGLMLIAFFKLGQLLVKALISLFRGIAKKRKANKEAKATEGGLS